MTFLLGRLYEEAACRSAVQRVYGCEAKHSCAACGGRSDRGDTWQMCCESSAVPDAAEDDTGSEASLVRHLHPAVLPQPHSVWQRPITSKSVRLL